MPFFLIIAGIIMMVSALRGVQGCLIAEIETEFQGAGSFIWWVAAIFMVGALGYSDTLRPISNAFLALIIIAMFLYAAATQNLFQQFTSAISAGSNLGATLSTIAGNVTGSSASSSPSTGAQ